MIHSRQQLLLFTHLPRGKLNLSVVLPFPRNGKPHLFLHLQAHQLLLFTHLPRGKLNLSVALPFPRNGEPHLFLRLQVHQTLLSPPFHLKIPHLLLRGKLKTNLLPYHRELALLVVDPNYLPLGAVRKRTSPQNCPVVTPRDGQALQLPL